MKFGGSFILWITNQRLMLSGFAGIIFFAGGVAWAEVLPGPAQPAPVSKALTAQQPKQVLKTLPAVAPPQQAPNPAVEAAKKIKFKLNAIILEGNHHYSNEQLSSIYKDKLHKVITVADLFNIVQEISNYYRNNGYIISRALLPPQHVKGGIVKVQIIEGFVDEVSVSGNPKGARCLIQAFGERIRECPPLELSRMEKFLLLANEIPATQVKAVLSPAKVTPGAADLTLLANNTPLTGYFSYDNYGTRYLGPQQLTANLGLNSIFQSGDSTQATVIKTPKGTELTYRDINYSMALDDNGVRWLLGDTHTLTHPLFVLAPAKIEGVYDNIYTTFSFPVIRTRSKNLTFVINLNYLDTSVNTFDTTLYTDHLRSLGIGGSFNFSDNWYGSNSLYADVRQGLPVLGYTSDTKPTAQTSRPGGRGDYTKIDMQVSRLQGIKNRPFSLFVLVKGQYGFNPLLAAEQFSYGGSQIGRGYDVAELLGDKGLAGTAEFRYDMYMNKILQSLQFYVYYDAGVIWNWKKIVGSPIKQSGMTTGFGARFYFVKYISGNVMWTQTLTKPIAAEQLIHRGSRPRIFFSVVAALPYA